MEIRKINVNNHTFQFINETWDTYNAWGHRTVLFLDDREIARNRCRYYNRTWEWYRYQTCMMGCVRKIINQIEDDYIASYKSKNDIRRLSKEKKEQALKELAETEKYKMYKAVLQDLRDNRM